MKRIFAAVFMILVLGRADARYDAFVAEAKSGLDYVDISSKGYAADGELGRTVYTAKVDDDYDIFIPTDNYVRIGAGANLGFASTMDYSWGWGPRFGFGWNWFSFMRFEIGWDHSDMRFEDGNADFDAGRMTLWFDLARRYVMHGDVTYRRRIVPFIGIGGVAGYARFDPDSPAIKGAGDAAYGGHAAFGLSFVFSDTNAIDLMIGYDMLYGRGFGWAADPVKQFGNTNISLSWRSGF